MPLDGAKIDATQDLDRESASHRDSYSSLMELYVRLTRAHLLRRVQSRQI